LRQTGQRLTSILIPPLMGGIANRWGTGESFFVLGAFMLLLGVLLALITRRAGRAAATQRVEPTPPTNFSPPPRVRQRTLGAPAAMKGIGETDSPSEREEFEFSVPLAGSRLISRRGEGAAGRSKWSRKTIRGRTRRRSGPCRRRPHL